MNNKKIDINKLYSATSLVHYIRSDCIIDYLDTLKKNNYEINSDNLKIKKRKFNQIDNIDSSNKKRKTSFDYISTDGYKFESSIFDLIKNKLELSNELDKLKEINELDINKRYKITKKILINKKHDIIIGGLLINEDNNTYGYPDLIVLGRWIKKYISNNNCEIQDLSYYIIDIKSSIIKLTDGCNSVSSNLLYNGYKMQIYVYSQALNNMLNTSINIGFILGKKYQYTLNNNKYCIDDPFNKLGIVNFLNGIDYSKCLSDTIKWKNYLSLNWKKLSLSPINNDLLYPNIKNSYDKNYKKIKKTIALANKDITLLWNCGIKQRNIAWSNGIKKYDNINLKPELLGLNKDSSKFNIINNLLKVNSSDSSDLVILDKLNNYLDWRTKVKYELFVDFETYSKSVVYGEDIIEVDEDKVNFDCLYMIGVNYVIKSVNMFKCFVIKFNGCDKTNLIIKSKSNLKCGIKSYVYCEDEKDLMIKFYDFIYSFNKDDLSTEEFNKNIRLIHWSSAEPIIFNKKINEYKLNLDPLNWYDLLKVFKYQEHPIVIKGCFGFSLKEVIKTLNNHNLIDIQWSDLDDGLLSSFIARREIYISDNDSNDININHLIDIVEYNYIDCLALNKLLKWMRSYNKN